MANVQVLRFCAFYNEHVGQRGSDKIWGIAEIENTLVTFWGRRSTTLRFKTQPKTVRSMARLLMDFNGRTGGRRDGDNYTPISSAAMIESLCPNLAQQISSDYYSSMSRGTLNTMKKAA